MANNSDGGFEQVISRTYGFGLEAEARKHMQEGSLAEDTLLRLSIIGAQVVDQAAEGLKRVNVLEALLAHVEEGAPLDADINELLYGQPPCVLLNFDHQDRETINTITQRYKDPYYTKNDLALAIKERRRQEGKTIHTSWVDYTRTSARSWTEDSVANGIAHGVWRALLARARPEWLTKEGLQGFWVPKVSKTHKGTRLKVELDANYSRMRRVLVSAALFSDDIVLELHQEAKSVGVKNLGKVGVHDLALMLSDQHPDLHPDI